MIDCNYIYQRNIIRTKLLLISYYPFVCRLIPLKNHQAFREKAVESLKRKRRSPTQIISHKDIERASHWVYAP